RVARMVQAEDVGLDFVGAARRDVEPVLDLDLRGRHLATEAGERGQVHDRAALDGDDLAGGDRLTGEEPAAFDPTPALFGLRAEPAAHERPPVVPRVTRERSAECQKSVSERPRR